MNNSNSKALKAGFAYTVGNVLLKGIAFLTLPIFSRMLNTTEFGLYNVYVAYQTIITIFTGLCLYGSLRTAKYDYKDNFNQYVYNIVSLSCLSFFIILFFANVFFELYSNSFEFNRTILNILIIHSYAMFIFQFYNVKLALRFEYKNYLIASSLNSILSTVASIVLILAIFNTNCHIGRIYGYAIIPIIIAIFIFISLTKEGIKKRWNPINISQWKYALNISLPLVIHTFSQQILNQFDRIMITKLVSAASSGIYSFVHTFANILQIIIQSMDNAWSTWFYDKLNEKSYQEIKNKMIAYILFMNVLYIGFISLAPDVMKIIGTESYYNGFSMIVPLSYAIYYIFLYSLPVHVEYFYKKTKFIALGTSLAAIINLILNYICILKYGYMAAAWTTALSYVLLYIFHQIIACKILKKDIFPFKTIVFSIIYISIVSLIITFTINLILFRWIIMIFSIFILFIFYKNYLIEMLNMIPIIKKLNFIGTYKNNQERKHDV